MSGAIRTRRWERRSEARPGELVRAAAELFSERGFAATRLEDVAARAGISKGTVYLYFDSKEALFEAVVREAITPNLDRAEALVKTYDGTTPNLVRLLVPIFEALLDGPVPAVLKILVAESGNFPQLARLYADLVIKRGLGFLTKIVQRGIDRGELRPVEAQHIAPLIVAPAMLLALYRVSFGPHVDLALDRRSILEAHVETLLRGLAADPTDDKLARAR